MRRWLRLLVPDTLSARTLSVMLVGVLIAYVATLSLHKAEVELLHSADRSRWLAHHLTEAEAELMARPPVARDELAHALSRAGLDLHWSATPLVQLNGAERIDSELNQLLAEVRPNAKPPELRVGYSDASFGADTHHLLLGSMALDDGSWLNFSAALFHLPRNDGPLLMSTVTMAAGILLIGLLVVRQVGRPLRELSAAADSISRDGARVQVAVQGPREVRNAAVAFNRMQARIDRILRDQTQTLAALSHDLRSPVARLRIRAGFVEDEKLQREFDADLDEMDQMIGDTLAYLRGEADEETPRPTDLAALLETIADEGVDSGYPARYLGPGTALVLARPVALKRAFTNLVNNAMHYGGRADISLDQAGQDWRVMIDDTGPGIPEKHMAAVFEPFRRLDPARQRGGSGLGLTIARQVLQGHGGQIALANRREGGLRVTVTLPCDHEPG